MANAVPIVIADFETQLASAISAGATSLTLASATDDDGTSLPAGKYCFTINNGSSNKQYLIGQLNGTAVTSVVNVTRQGVESSGAGLAARAGSPVIISDFATIQRVADILRGQENLDGDNPIVYDAEPTLSARAEVATVGYVLDQVNGGTVDFDNQIISSSDATAGETISAGDWVFFNTADQEWYQIDADTAAEVDAAYIGVALGSGTDGVSITSGVQISGVYTTSGLTAGDIYYLSNTAGAITNSAGTTERAIGVALSTTKLLMNFVEKRIPTADEKDAMAGGGDLGTPSSTNQFMTEDGMKDTDSRFTQRDVFTSSGTFTTPAGVSKIKVKIWGAGAGASGTDDTDVTTTQYTRHGQPGNYAEAIVTVSDSQQFTVTVGAGGSGDSSYDVDHAGPGGSSTVVDTATGASVFTLTCNGGASTIAFGAAGTISGSALVSDSNFTVIGAGAAGGIMPIPNNSSAQSGGNGQAAIVIIEY